MALPFLELLLDRVRFRLRMLAFALTVRPVAGGADPEDDDQDDADDDDDGSDDDEDSDEDSDDDSDSDDDDDDSDEDEHKKPSFLRRAARKHERRAKREKKRADRLDAENKRLKQQLKGGGKDDEDDKDNDRSEVDQAKADLDADRRSFRLEQSVTRIARKGIKLGDGKDAKTVKFQDPDDALVHIERAIEKGDLDADDIFDGDGKPKPDAVTEALQELLEDKPHLQAGKSRPKGGAADAGKGSGGSKELEDMSPEEHAERKYGKQK